MDQVFYVKNLSGLFIRFPLMAQIFTDDCG